MDGEVKYRAPGEGENRTQGDYRAPVICTI